MKSGTNWGPRFAVYGDLGNENAQSLPRIQDETEKGHFDAILHVGEDIDFIRAQRYRRQISWAIWNRVIHLINQTIDWNRWYQKILWIYLLEQLLLKAIST